MPLTSYLIKLNSDTLKKRGRVGEGVSLVENMTCDDKIVSPNESTVKFTPESHLFWLAFWQLNPTLMTTDGRESERASERWPLRANAFCHAISPLRLSVSDGRTDGSEQSGHCPSVRPSVRAPLQQPARPAAASHSGEEC